MLRILTLFDLDRAVLSPDWLMEQLGASRASVYRDLKQLTQAGLIERVDDRGFVLGSRIVELDRQIRLADPLLKAAGDLPNQLAKETNGTVLLCRLHINTVLCILNVSCLQQDTPISYERGRAMPLYRGATSKVILSQLPLVQLRDLIQHDHASITKSGLPNKAEELYESLAPLREQGYVVTKGEVDSQAVGFAVALLSGKRLLGSLSVVLPISQLTSTVHTRTLSLLQSTARRIEARLESESREVRTPQKYEIK